MFYRSSPGRTLLGLLFCGLVTLAPGLTDVRAADGNVADLTGQWYGGWQSDVFGYSSNMDVLIDELSSQAVVNMPEAELFFQPLPAVIGSGYIAWETDSWVYYPYFGPLYFEAEVLDQDSIAGQAWIDGYPVPVADWWIFREVAESALPDPAPSPQCENLPALFCIGDPEYCTELLPFDPDVGAGYLDYPLNGETWEDQYRSFARRDLIQLVQYAAAKVQCMSSSWGYREAFPIGLGDMSEEDGSIPGTSVGSPGHPPGSHEDGNDLDAAYYQLYQPDNLLRTVCRHFEGTSEAFHCVEEPYYIDRWRTALFVSYLAEHPHIRVIGVDGQVGLVLEEALDSLVAGGWIDTLARDLIPLAYEVEDTGLGWYRFHHHHLHVSMVPVFDIVSTFDLAPNSLQSKSKGNYVTAHLEFVEGVHPIQVDVSTVRLFVDGQTFIPALAEPVGLSDFNQNGIPDLALKFDREAVISAIGLGDVEVGITGYIDGLAFGATDTMFVR